MFLSSALFATVAPAAESFTFPQGRVELLQSKSTLFLNFTIADEWHIYWKNSGDSGAAPKWNWTIEGGEISNVWWPVPERISIAGLINFGYAHKSLFLFDLKPHRNKTLSAAKLKLEFLICKVECIPYFTDLEKTILSETEDATAEALKKQFVWPETTPIKFTQKAQTSETLTAELVLPGNLVGNLKNLEIFPEDGASFKTSVPRVEPDGKLFLVTLPLMDHASSELHGAKFLMVVEDSNSQKSAYELTLTKPKENFALILFWAFLGGFILNFMPCVFPVLSIKILSFIGPDKNHRQLQISGWLYTFGVVLSFIAIGGLLLILRAGGEQIGWGFQLQSPYVGAGIALLFFWLAFNFLGSFELGHSLVSLGANQKTSKYGAAFLTGVLATVVATPCTAPFMGAALGASLAMPPLNTMFVFMGLGFGMAVPFLILAYFPGALRILPRPGPWMVTMKEVLAFPLFLTVLWLLWVLSQQLQSEALIFILLILVFIGFCIWSLKFFKSESRQQKVLILGFLISFAALTFLPTQSGSRGTIHTTAWQEYSAEAVEATRDAGEAVFIDFTAAWCITCQVNKRLVLHTDEISQFFSKHKIQLYKADWTDRDPKITAALASFGRNSLPLYVFYSASSKVKNEKAQILPEILTQQMILNLIPKEEP